MDRGDFLRGCLQELGEGGHTDGNDDRDEPKDDIDEFDDIDDDENNDGVIPFRFSVPGRLLVFGNDGGLVRSNIDDNDGAAANGE